MKIDKSTRLKKRPGIPEANLSEENIVLLNAERGNYYSLKETALVIWRLLEEETSVEEICACLQKDFDVEVEACLEDTLEFCRHLMEENLIGFADEMAI